MEIDKIIFNGVEYDIGLEKYISLKNPADIIEQNHKLTLTKGQLYGWYNTTQPDYSYFTFTSDNKKLKLYTSRGNSCPQNIVYLLDSIKAGLSKDDLDSFNEIYGVDIADTDKITIYYGN